MTRTQRILIIILGLTNCVVYAGAIGLLWYIWPVLTESPSSVASAENFVMPVAAPTDAAARQVPAEERDAFPEPQQLSPLPAAVQTRLAQPASASMATPTLLVQSASTSVAAPIQLAQPAVPPAATPAPTPTPLTLWWPTKQGGASQSGKTAWGAPPLVSRVPLAPEQVNIIVMGADYRKGQANWRTDTLIIISVNPRDMTIRMLSIPRDLWVYVPGYGEERVNVADYLGERMGVNQGHANMIRQTIEMNLGIPIHYYLRINFDAFEKIINTLGGVTVQVDCPLQETIRDGRSPTGWSLFAVTPGIHHMDGWTALLLARSRKTTSDFDRSRRQQAIMKGVWQGALGADVLRDGPRLYAILKDSVDTDLTLQNMLALGYVAVRVRPESIRSYFINSSMVQDWMTAGGAMVLLPVHPRIAEVVQEMFSFHPPDPSKKSVDNKSVDNRAKVTVQDGVGSLEQANLFGSQLRWKGLKLIKVEPAARSDYAQTVIVDYGTSANPQSLASLCQMTGVPPASVRKEPNPTSPVDFLVILGRDYDPCANR